ncbi:MAG: histidine--tRNA ligase family protein [Chloroflexi bacterium]|nr:histidine--tRNA ligase family protein [Chloroflexota bacterium]
MRNPVRRLPGTSDILANQAELRASLLESLRSTLSRWGYHPIETPVVEESDLFLRKSGGELAAQLYSFTDPGGIEVSLRPEFTASVIRAYIERASAETLPVRWQYAGPVFRYQPLEQSPYRQVTQVGAETIGTAAPLADAEAVAVACQGLRDVGLEGFAITLGHLGVLSGFLGSFDLADKATMFLLSQVGALRDPARGLDWVRAQAQELRMAPNALADESLGRLIGRLSLEEARALVHQLLSGLEARAVGSRDMAEVEERFLEKLFAAEEPGKVEAALRFLSDLCHVRGRPAEALARAREVAREHRRPPAALASLAEMAGLLEGMPELQGVDVTVDLGFARGIAYYTGMVFEISHPTCGEVPLCGGGRYDGLVQALGGRETPALGFAYTLETVAVARGLPETVPSRSGRGKVTIVAPAGPEAGAAALAVASDRRAGGEQVEFYPRADGEAAVRLYAERHAATRLILVEAGGKSREIPLR